LRKIMLGALGALAAAAVLSGVALGNQATAMTIALPPLPSAAKPAPWPIQQVRNICGINGCAPVFTKRIQKPPRKFTATAAPLVVSGTQATAPAPAAAPAAPSTPWPLSLLQGKL
jgi:hypothetical protein